MASLTKRPAFFLHAESFALAKRRKSVSHCIVFHLPIGIRTTDPGMEMDLSNMGKTMQRRFLTLMRLRAQFVAALTDHQVEQEHRTEFSSDSRKKTHSAVISDARRSDADAAQVYQDTLEALQEHYLPGKTIFLFEWPKYRADAPQLSAVAEKLAKYVRRHGRLLTRVPRGFSLSRSSAIPSAK